MLRRTLKRWLWKFKHPWHSTGTSTDGSNSSLPSLQQVIQSSATYHTSAYRLPISTYINVVTEDNLDHLTILGTPNILELQDAFEKIVSEIAGIMHNDKTDTMIKMTKRIGLLQADIIYINYTLKYLTELFDVHQRTDKDLCTQFRKMGYDYKFDPSNAYQYKRELGFVKSRAKTLIQQRYDLLKEYQRMTNSQGGNGKSKTKEDYELELVELSSFQGYKLDKTSTMTSEYFAVLSRYNKTVQAQKKKEATNGRR